MAEHPDAGSFGALRAALLQDRAHTTLRLGAIGANLVAIDDASQFTSVDDEHDPEGVTIAFERSQASALQRAAYDHITEIDAATARMDDGSYGWCESCGNPIPLGRLEVRPFARMCVSCAEASAKAR